MKEQIEEYKKKIAGLKKQIASPKTAPNMKKVFEKSLPKVEAQLKSAEAEYKKELSKPKPKQLPPEVKKAVKNPDRFKKLIAKLKTQDAYKFLKRMSMAAITRDAQRTALPAGKRTSADGNVYYEYRKNRSDVSAKNKLAKGGDVGFESSYGEKLRKRAKEVNIAIKKGEKLVYAGKDILNISVSKEYGMDEAFVFTEGDKKYNAGSDIFSGITTKTGEKFGKEYEEYAKGGNVESKYKLGDMWSDDFDYEGMLKMGLNTDISWSFMDLQKLANSFEDVNYHTASKPLFEAIRALKNEGDNKKAKEKLEEFHKLCKEEISAYFAK